MVCKKMEVSFYSVELGMQTLCLVSTRKRDWKPKGNCWLCVEIWLTMINTLAGKCWLSCQLFSCSSETLVVNNLMHTDSNYMWRSGRCGDCSVSRLPREDRGKEDPSSLTKYYTFLKTLTQKSAGCEIAGLELKLWSSQMDTGSLGHTVKSWKKMDSRENLLPHRWSCGSLQHWTLCLLWIRWTCGSTWEMSQSVSRTSCLVVLQPLGSLPVSR